jgi:hypothetical protein
VNSWKLLCLALTSFKAVQNLLDQSYGARAPKLVRVITAHSMGNYLLSQALISGNIADYAGLADRAVMLAPDVDERIFTQGSPVLDQGEAIYRMASGNVRMYWTGGSRHPQTCAGSLHRRGDHVRRAADRSAASSTAASSARPNWRAAAAAVLPQR